MREFCVYVDVTKKGKLRDLQLDQMRALIDALSNRRINFYWIIEGEKISTIQVFNIIRNVHLVSKKKNVIIHNEICVFDKTISICGKLALKQFQISTFLDKRKDSSDNVSLYYMNQPAGCMFNSCLGHTLYLKRSGELLLCPYATGIRLKPIRLGESCNAVFDTDDFKKLLLNQIQKRNRCKSECRLFNCCHGGCPIQDDKEKCSILMSVEQQNPTAEMKLDQEIRRLSGLYRG